MNTALVYKAYIDLIKKSDEEWQAFLAEYRDDEKPVQEGMVAIKEDMQAGFQEAAKGWHDKTVTINRPSLNPLHLAHVGFTPGELVTLSPILDMRQWESVGEGFDISPEMQLAMPAE